MDEYGFPRVHNFNLPQIRFDDLESRLAAIPARIAAAHANHDEVIPADDGLNVDTVIHSRPVSILEAQDAHQRQQTLLMMGRESCLTSPEHAEEKEDSPAGDVTPPALDNNDIVEVADLPEDGTCD